jgi:transposase-like protein
MRTAEEKLSIVEEFLNPGERTKRQIAEEAGVTPSLIYNWAQRVQNGESLEPRQPGPPPKNKGTLERAKARASIVLASQAASRAPAKAKAAPAPAPAPAPVQLHIEAMLPQDVRIEIAFLREENERLRLALEALLRRRSS